MGVLDIRMRSVSLGNYGTPATAKPLDLRSVAAIQNQTTQMQSDFAVRGLQQVSNMAQEGIKLGVELYKRESERKITNAANAVQDKYDAFNIGNGDGKSGAMNEQFDPNGNGGAEWLNRTGRKFDEILNDVCGDDEAKGGLGLSAGQKEQVRQRLSNYRRGWADRQAARARAIYNRNEIEGVDNGVAGAGRTLLNGNGDAQAWDDFGKAVQRQVDVYKRQGKVTTPEGELEMWRESYGRVVQGVEKRRLAEIAASPNVIESEDPKQAAAVYDEEIKRAEENPSYLTPPDEMAKKALGEDAAAYNKQYVASLKSAKKTAMHNADANRNRKVREVSFDSQNAEADMLLSKGWESLTPAQKADQYRRHLTNPSGKCDANGREMTWAEAYKTYNPARAKVIQRTIDSFTKEAQKPDKDVEDYFERNLALQVVPMTDDTGRQMTDANGRPMFEEWTPQARMDAANEAYLAGKIGDDARVRIIKRNQGEYNKQMVKLSQETLGDLKVRHPNAIIFNAKNADGSGSFSFHQVSKVDSADEKTGVRYGKDYFFEGLRGKTDTDYDTTYADVVDCLNLTNDWWRKHSDKSYAEAQAYLKSLMEGKDIDGRYYTQQMTEHMADERNKLSLIQSTIGRRTFTLGKSAGLKYGLLGRDAKGDYHTVEAPVNNTTNK